MPPCPKETPPPTIKPRGMLTFFCFANHPYIYILLLFDLGMKKHKVMIMLDIKLHELAKSLGLNISATCNDGLKTTVGGLMYDKELAEK